MDANPAFWTPQVLEEKELNDICTWLFSWQKACVTSDSLSTDFLEEGEKSPSQQLDPNFKVAMGHIEALIRHIRATKGSKFKRGDILVCSGIDMAFHTLGERPLLGNTYNACCDSYITPHREVVEVFGLVGAYPVSWFRKYWDLP
jgi:hypothetical protein